MLRVLTVLMVFLLSSPVYAEDEHTKAAKDLLEITEFSSSIPKMVELYIQQMSLQNPNIKESYLN